MTMWSLLVDDGGGEDVLGRLEELLLLLPAITANAAVPWTLALLGKLQMGSTMNKPILQINSNVTWCTIYGLVL